MARVPGMFFEDFEVGVVLAHEMRRTVTESDNVWFSAITMNPQPLHIDEEFSKGSMYKQRIVNSILTLGLVVGLTVAETTLGTTLGNLGFREVRFPKPVFHGDTIRAETEVLQVRDSRSQPQAGIVTVRHRGFNQHDELVCECERVFMMKRRLTPASPDA